MNLQPGRPSQRRRLLVLVWLPILVLSACTPAPDWSPTQRTLIDSLSLDHLGAPPADPSNRVAADAAAATLGERLFHDRRLSANGQVSCSSCHRPEYHFADPRRLSRGIGETRRHAPTLLGAAWSQWFYWDGRRDSLWAQALTPLEHPDEHGSGRPDLIRYLASDADYATTYQAVFGEPLPGDAGAPDAGPAIDAAFANLGKALAAFVASLAPAPGRFDRYARALREGSDPDLHLSAAEREGLALFIGKGQCVNCHNGPLLTNHDFHNVGTVQSAAEPRDNGRWQGLREVAADPFNCLGAHSDAPPEACALRYAQDQGAHLPGAFKVPTLRNVAVTPPYMHDGQFAALDEVIDHYAAAPSADRLGHQEIVPLALTAVERRSLAAFLGTLTGD